MCILWALAGCKEERKSEQAAHNASPAAKPQVALVMKTLTNPFFAEMELGARQAAAEDGADLVVKTASKETSIDQQVGIIDALVRDKVAAIVIAPGDSVRLIPPLKKAQDAASSSSTSTTASTPPSRRSSVSRPRRSSASTTRRPPTPSPAA